MGTRTFLPIMNLFYIKQYLLVMETSRIGTITNLILVNACFSTRYNLSLYPQVWVQGPFYLSWPIILSHIKQYILLTPSIGTSIYLPLCLCPVLSDLFLTESMATQICLFQYQIVFWHLIYPHHCNPKHRYLDLFTFCKLALLQVKYPSHSNPMDWN